MSETLYTLTAPGRHQIMVKKSRFLAHSAPVCDLQAALAFVHEMSDAGAHHNCWAWRVGQAYRFNDDGEPSGSAGKPILAAIDGQRLDGVVVVVTRWFGGIKLGVGGLIRAYGGTAAECLRLGEHRPIVEMSTLCLECGYAELERLRARMQPMAAEIRSEDFGAYGVSMRLVLPTRHLDALAHLVADVTHGQGRLKKLA